MGKKGITVGALIVLFVSTVFFIGWFFFYTRSDQSMHREEIEEVSREIEEIQKLGFPENSQGIQLMHAYGEWLANPTPSATRSDRQKLELLITLHRRVLKRCLVDAREYQKEKTEHAQAMNASLYDTMARLTISLADLEKEHDDHNLHPGEYGKKLERIKQIAKNMFYEHKKEVWDVLRVHDTSSLQLVQHKLTDTIRLWQEAEREVW